MPEKKILLKRGDETYLASSKRQAAVLAKSGWKPAPKSEQPDNDKK